MCPHDEDQYTETPQRKDDTLPSKRNKDWWLNLIIVPVKFILSNLPAVLPAWLGASLFTDMFFDSSGSFFTRSIFMLLCFALFTFIIWKLLIYLHDKAMLMTGSARYIALSLGAAYIFASYAVPVWYFLRPITVSKPSIGYIIGSICGLIGLIFYYVERIRKNPSPPHPEESKKA